MGNPVGNTLVSLGCLIILVPIIIFFAVLLLAFVVGIAGSIF